jgi:hypothetical protein
MSPSPSFLGRLAPRYGLHAGPSGVLLSRIGFIPTLTLPADLVRCVQPLRLQCMLIIKLR